MAQSRQSYIADIVSACMLLSRLPCGWYKFDDENPPRLDMAGWAFPIIGFIIGAIGAASLITMQAIGIGALGAAACGVVVMTLLSGALHDDGLADMADGFGGGRTVGDKIRIMHDSRVGSYGVMALCLSVVMRVSLLAKPRRPAHRTIFICTFNGIMGGGVALANIRGCCAFFPSLTKPDSGQLTSPPPLSQLTVATMLWLLPCGLLFKPNRRHNTGLHRAIIGGVRWQIGDATGSGG
jgi:adenosylcobinamide-GDP ribazoletransferase